MHAHMALTHNLQHLLLYCLFCCKWDHKFKNEYHALLKKTGNLHWKVLEKCIAAIINHVNTVGLFHLSEDLPPVRHMKECRSKTLVSLCLLFLITYDQTFPAFSVCDDLARGSDCWLYWKPPWPTRQQLGTHRRSTAETHERTDLIAAVTSTPSDRQ